MAKAYNLELKSSPFNYIFHLTTLSCERNVSIHILLFRLVVSFRLAVSLFSNTRTPRLMKLSNNIGHDKKMGNLACSLSNDHLYLHVPFR